VQDVGTYPPILDVYTLYPLLLNLHFENQSSNF
jgi:hypothetical protein